MSEEFDEIGDHPVFLCTAKDHIELAIIESMMRGNNIPILKNWRNGGDVTMIYMAVSFIGVDLYVPSKLLERAKEL